MLPFRVDKIFPEEDGSRINQLDALDISINKTKTTYYMVLENGVILEDEYVANIDEAINVEMERFLVIKDDSVVFINTQLHKNLEGNFPLRAKKLDPECSDENLVLNSLQEKIEYLTTQKKQQFLIKKYEEILNG